MEIHDYAKALEDRNAELIKALTVFAPHIEHLLREMQGKVPDPLIDQQKLATLAATVFKVQALVAPVTASDHDPFDPILTNKIDTLYRECAKRGFAITLEADTSKGDMSWYVTCFTRREDYDLSCAQASQVYYRTHPDGTLTESVSHALRLITDLPVPKK